MRELPTDLAAHIAGGATTLCTCWRVTRTDGVVLGFTDHDRRLSFDGTDFLPESGVSATAMEASLGLEADNLDVIGALISDALTPQDLDRGVYDQARVEIFRVNWADPEQRLLLRGGEIGEVVRGRHAFTAEVRGLSQRLDQPVGRVFQGRCGADLGDHRCQVDVALSVYRADAAVSEAAGPRSLRVAGLSGFAAGWFSGGRLTWQSGANAGYSADILSHGKAPDGDVLDLMLAPPAQAVPDDVLTVTAGCDKRFATCRDKFANTDNFRGFPHMPGNDWVVSYPRQGEDHDGGKRP